MFFSRKQEFSFPLDPHPRPSPKLRGEARASSPLSGEREGVGDREGWDGGGFTSPHFVRRSKEHVLVVMVC